MAAPSLDSLLETALADSSPTSAQDVLVVVVHTCLLSAGYECVAIGDEVCSGLSISMCHNNIMNGIGINYVEFW